MPDISIKNVPEEVLVRLKEQAEKNHRSLQGELIVILEMAVKPTRLSLEDVYSRITELGLSTDSESVEFIREDRDATKIAYASPPDAFVRQAAF